jgi:hypothetical protein
VKELEEYRQKMLERMREVTREFRAACEAAKDPFAAAEDSAWNIHQLASHTRDVDKYVYGMRARRTATEENPEFKGFDADSWMSTHYDHAEPLAHILDELTTSVNELVEFLVTSSGEVWSRESRHQTLGSGFTTQTWVERGLAHIEEHLASVKKTT